jgi:hypothetical protein
MLVPPLTRVRRCSFDLRFADRREATNADLDPF